MTILSRLLPSWLPWVAGLILLAAVYAAANHRGETAGAARIQALWNAEKIARDQAQLAAVARRDAENTAALAAQQESNRRITKGKDDELSKVRAALAGSERMRLGAAWCGGNGSAGAPIATGARSGDDDNTGGRVLPEELERAVQSLILESETAAATGRAAQDFIRANGMAP